jgi:dolichyl-phosphate-mannose-protein mannosyltransferase
LGDRALNSARMNLEIPKYWPIGGTATMDISDTRTRSGTAGLARAFAEATAFAQSEPGKVLAIVLGVHLVVWTLLPILVCHNLQLDLVEDLALGKEWQLGYWKHPPLPWWAADLVFRATGSIASVYLLGPLAAVVCLYGVWLLGKEIVDPFQALLGVLVLEGIHFYNFSVVKFAHDQMQLPFWAFAALLFHRAIVHGRFLDWLLAGALLAGAFWSKYAAVVLAATFALILVFDPLARRAWRTGGPFAMAAAFAVVVAPNAWALVNGGFQPLYYADARAKAAAGWYDYVFFPVEWIGNELFFLLPAIGLLALLYWRHKRVGASAPTVTAAFDRRYLAALGLGPFAVTTAVALVLGRLPVSMWGYPLWSFAPLAMIAWRGPVTEPRRLQRFAQGFTVLFVAWPSIYAAVEILEPLVRDREKATQFPGTAVAARLTQEWRDRYGVPLVYVCGSEFVANNIAVYSPDRPHVIVRCDPNLAPWIDMADVRRHGAVVAWEETLAGPTELAQWQALLGGFEERPVLVLPRQIWPRRQVQPTRVFYAIAPLRPQ